MLDFSRQAELRSRAGVVADVLAAAAPLGLSPLIVGAFARDLHLQYAHGVPTERETEDLDFAFAMPNWAAFDSLRARLVESGSFAAGGGSAHRLRHRGGLPVDLLPFGKVERGDRTIAWPRGESVLDVFGFREAQRTAVDVILPGGVRARAASLPALALLKLICWHDRRYATPLKDAHDLRAIVEHYLEAGNEKRLWSEFRGWTQESGFDYGLSGARMLGHDLRALLEKGGVRRIATFLAEQASSRKPAPLPTEMMRGDPDRARSLLAAIRRGLTERRRA